MTAEKMQAYNKAYYQAHKEQVAAHNRAYYQAHREEKRASSKAYYHSHKEQRAAYYQAHKEKIAAYNKAYCQAHKEQVAAYNKAYYQAHKKKPKRKIGTNGIYGCVDCFYFGVEHRGRFYCAHDKKRLYPMKEEPRTGCFMKDERGRYKWFSMWEKPSEARR